MKNRKYSLNIVSTINLDELKDVFREQFHSNELVNFIFELAEDYSQEEEFYLLLKKKLDKVFD